MANGRRDFLKSVMATGAVAVGGVPLLKTSVERMLAGMEPEELEQLREEVDKRLGGKTIDDGLTISGLTTCHPVPLEPGGRVDVNHVVHVLVPQDTAGLMEAGYSVRVVQRKDGPGQMVTISRTASKFIPQEQIERLRNTGQTAQQLAEGASSILSRKIEPATPPPSPGSVRGIATDEFRT
jgi:hypothetical protein